MRTVILGCGRIGVLTGHLLTGPVTGIRRSPEASVDARFPIIAGDIADPVALAALPEADAVLLAANPGLRRGRDHGLVAAVHAAHARWPLARFVYTGSTSVYADCGGQGADESAPLADDAAARGLLAIEAAVLSQPGALVLRATALVGPTRTFARDRLLAGERVVKGDPARPFSFLHERDLAELCALALAGGLGGGVLNAVSPERLTVADYYRCLAHAAGLGEVSVTGDGTTAPARWIDASRLRHLQPQRVWRGVCDSCSRDDCAPRAGVRTS